MSNIFKDLNGEDFREMIVLLFCVIAFIYIFVFSAYEVPEANQRYVDQGFTVCIMILGKLLFDFVTKPNRIDGESGTEAKTD